jgi:hypothetical protein
MTLTDLPIPTADEQHEQTSSPQGRTAAALTVAAIAGTHLLAVGAVVAALLYGAFTGQLL